MSKKVSEFTHFLTESGIRALDQLAASRPAPDLNAGAEEAPPDLAPLDGLAARWSALSAEEKAAFLRQAAGPRKRTVRARRAGRTGASRKGARSTSDIVGATAQTKSPRSPDKKRKKTEKEARKQAKKEAKAQAKQEKKLKKQAKKDAKAKAQLEKTPKKKLEKKAKAKKPNASVAKTAKMNATANRRQGPQSTAAE